MRALRKKANKAAKNALTNPAAYGQLMTVTHSAARPSQHARNMLKGEARLSDDALLTCPSMQQPGLRAFLSSGTAQFVWPLWPLPHDTSSQPLCNQSAHRLQP